MLPLFHFLLSSVLYAHFCSISEVIIRSSATTMWHESNEWVKASGETLCTCFPSWEWGGLFLNPSKWAMWGIVLRFGAIVKKQFSILVFDPLMCSHLANLAHILFTSHPRGSWHFCSAISAHWLLQATAHLTHENRFWFIHGSSAADHFSWSFNVIFWTMSIIERKALILQLIKKSLLILSSGTTFFSCWEP